MYRGNKKVKMTSERTTTGINDQCDSLKVGNKRKVERKRERKRKKNENRKGRKKEKKEEKK